LETGFEEQLLHEGIADLDSRTFFGRRLVEFRRGHRRAMNSVAAGLGADVVDGVADAARLAFDDRIVPREAETKDVHQRIASVGLVEHAPAADRRNADAVAVAADARDDAPQNPPRARIVDWAESQRVEKRNRPRAHREDVADDAAD